MSRQNLHIEDYVKVSYCYSPDDYLAKAEVGMINVFYMPKSLLVNFLECLRLRYSIPWISIFFDEIQEVAPQNAPGREYFFVDKFAKEVGQLAKASISFYCASQWYGQVSSAVRAHMQYWVFMPMAIKPHGRNFRVFQKHLMNLKLGTCCVEGLEGFVDVSFKKYEPYRIFKVKMKPLYEDGEELEEEADLNFAATRYAYQRMPKV